MARTQALDYGEKRNAILKRSARLFADGGFERTSMSSVAGECGVSKPLLYHYYTNKEELLFDIINGHLEELCAAITEADDPAAEPEERLRILVRTLLDCYRDADAEHKVQINALSALPADKQDALKALERKLVTVFAEAVKGINPAVDDKKSILKPVTMSLFGMLNWHYMWFRPKGGISREDYAELATDLFVKGLKGIR